MYKWNIVTPECLEKWRLSQSNLISECNIVTFERLQIILFTILAKCKNIMINIRYQPCVSLCERTSYAVATIFSV